MEKKDQTNINRFKIDTRLWADPDKGPIRFVISRIKEYKRNPNIYPSLDALAMNVKLTLETRMQMHMNGYWSEDVERAKKFFNLFYQRQLSLQKGTTSTTNKKVDCNGRIAGFNDGERE